MGSAAPGLGDLEFRSYAPGDEEALIALYSQAYQRPYDLERWRWQYPRHPRADLDGIILCWSGEKLAGHIAYAPYNFRVDGRVVPGALQQSVFVDSAFRRRGIAGRLVAELCDYHDTVGLEVDIVYPNDRSLGATAGTGRWEHICDIFPYELPVSEARAPAEVPLRIEVADEASFTQQDMACFEREIPRGAICRCREAEVLSWRFHADSGRGYRVVRAMAGDQVAGLAVIKPYAPDRCIDLVELAAPDDEDLLRALLQGAAGAFGWDDQAQLKVWSMEHYPLHGALLRMGFRREERPTHVLVRVTSPGVSESWTDPASWYLSMADSDVY